MFSKVLIATDSSPAAAAVVDCACELRHLGTQKAVLAQCFMIPEHVAFPDEIESNVKTSLAPHRQRMEQIGIETEIIAEPGLPGIVIPQLAEREQCSLLAIGSHGHNYSSEIFLGGTAAEILHRTTRPLLIVRIRDGHACNQQENAKQAKERCNFRRHVLFPTDFSDHAEFAFSYLSAIVKKGVRKVTLLHVQEESKIRRHLEHRLEEFNRIDRDRLEVLKSRLNEIGDASVDVRISYGAPSVEILKVSRAASLIVMGTHGRGFVSEFFLGSVSHNIARHACAPTLLIPLKD